MTQVTPACSFRLLWTDMVERPSSALLVSIMICQNFLRNTLLSRAVCNGLVMCFELAIDSVCILYLFRQPC